MLARGKQGVVRAARTDLPKGCHAKLRGSRRDAVSTFEETSARESRMSARRGRDQKSHQQGMVLWSMIPDVALIRLR
jgi:hypothetical protein